jgi:dipeptide/tripeptide permease
VLDLSPEENLRPSYIAVFNAAINLTAFIAPLLGVLLYQQTSMALVFDLASGLRLMGLLFMVWKLGISSNQAKEEVA